MFTRGQKKFIKSNIRKLGITELAKRINASENEILDYLENRWGKEKFQIYKNSLQNSKSKFRSLPDNIFSSSIKKLITNPFCIQSLFLLTIVVFATYINSLNNVFVSDDLGILQNKNIGTFKDIISQPLTPIRPFFYLIAYKIGGFNPIFFRLINIFLHLGSTWLVFLIFLRLTNKRLAFITSLIFAVHPILAESIVWVAGGGYAQYSFFFLLAFFLYLYSEKNYRHYILSIVFFVFSIFSSVMAVAVSPMFMIYELCFGNIKKNYLKTIPYMVMAGVIVLVFIKGGLAFRQTNIRKMSYQSSQITINPTVQIPAAISSYLQLIAWPDKLTLYHSELIFTPVEYILRVLITLGLLVSLIFLWKKSRLIFFWLSLFILSLTPTLTPFGVSWAVAERYVYLGSIGLILIIGYGLTSLINNQNTRNFGYVLCIVWVIGLMTRTIIRNVDWKNEDNLWMSMKDISPSDPKTHNNLGDMYARHNDLDKSITEFKRAIELNPNYGDAMHNLANIYLRKGDLNTAFTYYQKALVTNPNLWQSYLNIGSIYYKQQNYLQAASYIEKAIQINSNDDNLYLNLGIVYLQMNNVSKGKELVEKALFLNPQNTQAKEILMMISKQK